jgi:hypothetical protein
VTDDLDAMVNACTNELAEMRWPTDDKHTRAQACIEYAVMLMVHDDGEDYLTDAMNEAISHYSGGAK